jgi:hypothetical protein
MCHVMSSPAPSSPFINGQGGGAARTSQPQLVWCCATPPAQEVKRQHLTAMSDTQTLTQQLQLEQQQLAAEEKRLAECR